MRPDVTFILPEVAYYLPYITQKDNQTIIYRISMKNYLLMKISLVWKDFQLFSEQLVFNYYYFFFFFFRQILFLRKMFVSQYVA